MTIETDVKQQIATLRRVLAGATKECGVCEGQGELKEAVQAWDVPGAPIPDCDTCKGTGRIPRFPGFRQECQCTKRGTPGFLWAGASVAWPNCPPGTEPCCYCEGHTGWQVAPGGLEDALAGLSVEEGAPFFWQLSHWFRCTKTNRHFEADGVECRLRLNTPSADEILRRAIAVAGLSVAHSVGDSCHGGLGHAIVDEKLNDTDQD